MDAEDWSVVSDGSSPRNLPDEAPSTRPVATNAGTDKTPKALGSASGSELGLQACDSQSAGSGTASPPDLNAAFGQAEPRLDDGMAALSVSRRIFGMQSRLAAEHHSPVDTFRATSRAVVLDMVSAGTDLAAPPPPPITQYLNLLVVGDCGSGKTTLVSNLLLGAVKTSIESGSVSTTTGKLQLEETTATAHSADGRCSLQYTIREVQGGLEADELAGVVDVINACLTQHFELDLDPSRMRPLHLLPDRRPDACLLLLPAHGLPARHIKAAKELAKLLPVIPVISKADSCTPAELERQRCAVQDGLGLSTAVLYSASFQFDHLTSSHGEAPGFADLLMAECQAARLGPERLPLATIASQEMDDGVLGPWPVRRYPWGTCETMVSEHSDVCVLRRMLASGLPVLKAATEQRYYARRCWQLIHLTAPEPAAGSDADSNGVGREARDRGQEKQAAADHAAAEARREADKAAEQAAREKVAKQKAAVEQAAKLKAAAEQAAMEKAAKEEAAAWQAAMEKVANQKAAAEQVAMEKAAKERAAAEKKAAAEQAAKDIGAKLLHYVTGDSDRFPYVHVPRKKKSK